MEREEFQCKEGKPALWQLDRVRPAVIATHEWVTGQSDILRPGCPPQCLSSSLLALDLGAQDIRGWEWKRAGRAPGCRQAHGRGPASPPAPRDPSEVAGPGPSQESPFFLRGPFTKALRRANCVLAWKNGSPVSFRAPCCLLTCWRANHSQLSGMETRPVFAFLVYCFRR